MKEDEWKDCFLIGIESAGNKVKVYMDSDNAITFDRCRKMSRHLEEFLDEKNFSGGKYVLEVSSPGVDRPLTMHRQYIKNVGRNLKINTSDGRTIKGVLKEALEDKLLLEVVDPEDKKKKKTIEQWLDLNQVDKALVQISFK